MISDYRNKKASGLVTLEKDIDSGEIKSKIKKFDEWTGQPVSDVEEALDITALERELAIRQAQVLEIDELIKDAKKL